MKGIVEARALRQQDAGIAPPEDNSNGSAPEDLPEGDDEEEEDLIVWPSDDSLLSEYVMEPDPDVGGSSSQPPAPPS